MRSFERARIAFVLALLSPSCGQPPPRAATRAAEASPPEEHLEEPYLPVRTEFSVVLDQAIGTHQTTGERAFVARVRHPVRSPQNEIVLQTGARVRGRIVAVESKPALHLKVRFDDVETTWGRASIAATVRSAEPYASAMPGMGGGQVPYDATLYMPVSEPAPVAGVGVGGGPHEAAILLPKGAELRLMLVQPIVAPPQVRSRR
jgi:hypothetical protein